MIAKLPNVASVTDVQQMQANVTQRLGLTGELAAKWAAACDERSKAILAWRKKGTVGA